MICFLFSLLFISEEEDEIREEQAPKKSAVRKDTNFQSRFILCFFY